MTDDKIALCQLVEKSSDADLLREMIGTALAVDAIRDPPYGSAAGDGVPRNRLRRLMTPTA